MEFSLGSGLIRTWLGAPLGEMVRLQTHNGCRQGCTAWPRLCTTFNSCMDSKHQSIKEYCRVKFSALIIPNEKDSWCIQCSVHFWPAGPFDESSLELVSWAFHIAWRPAYCISFLKRRRQSLIQSSQRLFVCLDVCSSLFVCSFVLFVCPSVWN